MQEPTRQTGTAAVKPWKKGVNNHYLGKDSPVHLCFQNKLVSTGQGKERCKLIVQIWDRSFKLENVMFNKQIKLPEIYGIFKRNS